MKGFKIAALLLQLLIITVFFCSCNEISQTQAGNDDTTSADSFVTTPVIEDIITVAPVDESSNVISDSIPDSSSDEDSSDELSETSSTSVTTTPEPTTTPQLTTTPEPTTTPVSTTTPEPIITTEPTTTPESTTPPVETTEPTTTENDIEIVVPPTNSYSPLNFNVQNGMWISYLDLYPILQGKSESSFRASFGVMLDNSRDIGCNTVYVHCRAFSDAYYESDYFPWTKYCTGTAGVSGGYDPLEIMVEEAHKRGMSVHAWINPMRIDTEKVIKQFPSDSIIKQWYDSGKVGTYIMPDDDSAYYWLNPAYEEVRALICNGVTEIIANYDVDGVHIDDYFYPTTDKSFDSKAFAQSGASDLTAWRTDIISRMVSDMYKAVKRANPNVLFGVSPQGNIDNNYTFMYADVRKWCSESGYLDYIIPQIYFGFENQWCPFDKTAKAWSDMVTNPNVKIIYGLGIYNLGTNNEFTYGTQIFSRQISTCMNLSNYDGVALYRYDSCFNPVSTVKSQTQREVNEIRDILTN